MRTRKIDLFSRFVKEYVDCGIVRRGVSGNERWKQIGVAQRSSHKNLTRGNCVKILIKKFEHDSRFKLMVNVLSLDRLMFILRKKKIVQSHIATGSSAAVECMFLIFNFRQDLETI